MQAFVSCCRGTVRSKSNTAKVSHLLKLAEALPGSLELHEADLLQPGDFDGVVKGADFVLHTASPFFTETSDPQKDLIDPAVNGTRTVLDSAGKAKIKRVILTSSVAGKLWHSLHHLTTHTFVTASLSLFSCMTVH